MGWGRWGRGAPAASPAFLACLGLPATDAAVRTAITSGTFGDDVSAYLAATRGFGFYSNLTVPPNAPGVDAVYTDGPYVIIENKGTAANRAISASTLSTTVEGTRLYELSVEWLLTRPAPATPSPGQRGAAAEPGSGRRPHRCRRRQRLRARDRGGEARLARAAGQPHGREWNDPVRRGGCGRQQSWPAPATDHRRPDPVAPGIPMIEEPDRDRAIGGAYWTHMRAFQRQVAARSWEKQLLVSTMQSCNTALFADLQAGDVDGAARMWLQGCWVTAGELDALGSATLRKRGGRLTAWPLLAGDEDLLVRVLQVAPPQTEPDPKVNPYQGMLRALVAGDDAGAFRMAEAYEALVTPQNWRKKTALPHLGAIAIAILDDDANAATVHMTATLEAETAARKRGYMRNHKYVSFYTAGLWAAARRRDVDIDIPDHFHAVPLNFTFDFDIDVDGQNANGERFTWPTDLLPTRMFIRAAQLRADDV